MPHSTLRLIPGVDQNRTSALNEGAISTSNLVRFIPDRQNNALCQKIGGWTKFYTSKLSSPVRALWAWQDTNARQYLGVGSQTVFHTVTGVSGNGTTATITFSGSNQYSVGSEITVSGIITTPSSPSYNGTFTVTGSTLNTVSFASSTTSSYDSGGVVSATDCLSIISNGTQAVLTPKITVSNVAVSADTTLASSLVQINDAGSNVQSFDTVDIKTQISVGGLVLFGTYPTNFVSANSWQIRALNALGNPASATSTVAGGGAVPRFYTTSGSSLVDVVLYNHGYIVGDTFPALVLTTVSGIDVYGNYTIVEIDTLAASGPSVGVGNSFRIIASTKAAASTNAYMNGGNAKFIYYRTPLPLPTTTGYGVGGYGVGGYGTGVAPTAVYGTPITATDWTFDNWGQVFIACPVGGQIYQWSPTSGLTTATIIGNAPTVNDGMFVAMPQRQIVAWGSTVTGIQDPMLITWCDVDNYNQWIPLVTNQAGSYRIPKGSKIVACIQGPQQGLIWTDLAIWAMQYSGPPYVYQFNEIGTGCGLIARKAAASMNGTVYWMSQSQFFRLGPGGVEPIRCPIWDVVFQDLDTSNLDKIRIAPNSRFGEISWFYPTTSGNGEITNYVKYNVVLDQWDFGSLARTAWINQSVLGPPIGAGTTNGYYIYQHETSTDADGAPINASFQTGYYVLSDAEWKIFIDQVWPDMKWGYYDGAQTANVLLTFYVTDYPGQQPQAYGPYTMTQSSTYITPRFRGRLVSIKIESNDIGSFWRVGAMRYRYQQDGKF